MSLRQWLSIYSSQMPDSLQIKFRYNNPKNYFFKERVSKKEIGFGYQPGERYVYTNQTWRKQKQAKGIYVPKYGICEEFLYPDKTYLFLEFSVPKMINQENLTEISENDLIRLISEIVIFLKKINVHITYSQIEEAIPTLIAIGKNISLTDICPCDTAIKILSPFDYKPHTGHRAISFNDYKKGGRELYFNIQNTETVKFYDKKREIINNAKTNTEKLLAEKFKKPDCALEILRTEITYKTPRKIRQKFKPYLKDKTPTLKNIFKEDLWTDLLKQEIDLILNHPLKNFIFLSTEQKPFIDAFLDKHYKHIATKDAIRGIIDCLQASGLAMTRQRYIKGYKSRQTWYNYLKRLRSLEQYIDINALNNLEAYQIHKYILEQFEIEISYQPNIPLDFNNNRSNKIDA